MVAGNGAPGEALTLDEIQGNIPGFNEPFQSFDLLRFKPGQKVCDFIHAVLLEIDTADEVEEFNTPVGRTRDAATERHEPTPPPPAPRPPK